MNKNIKDVVRYVSDKTMITERDAGLIYDVVIDCLRNFLIEGHTVKIRNFGTFYTKERKPRKAAHPKDGTPIVIPAKNIVKFRASETLTEKVN